MESEEHALRFVLSLEDRVVENLQRYTYEILEHLLYLPPLLLGLEWIEREKAAIAEAGEAGEESERCKRQQIKEDLGIDLEWAMEAEREHDRSWRTRERSRSGGEDQLTEEDFDIGPYIEGEISEEDPLDKVPDEVPDEVPFDKPKGAS